MVGGGIFAVLGVVAATAGTLAFITLFGAMSYLTFRKRGGHLATIAIPAVGALGAVATVVALTYHLVTIEPHVCGTVLVLVIAILGVELLYFERESILKEVQNLEERV